MDDDRVAFPAKPRDGVTEVGVGVGKPGPRSPRAPGHGEAAVPSPHRSGTRGVRGRWCWNRQRGEPWVAEPGCAHLEEQGARSEARSRESAQPRGRGEPALAHRGLIADPGLFDTAPPPPPARLEQPATGKRHPPRHGEEEGEVALGRLVGGGGPPTSRCSSSCASAAPRRAPARAGSCAQAGPDPGLPAGGRADAPAANDAPAFSPQGDRARGPRSGAPSWRRRPP